ncbi:MaoC/PaaZ C-terminal domain-containing protein [Euzebya sp.]|uniref:MaoC/PaaZ C-terminal domain-containing protein n=1 Tax=Euzebya sp. TaxID=1971409 RepID=UPI003513E073
MRTVQPGDAIPPFTVDGVDAERMKTMAVLLRDPNPIHFDADVVRELGMGDRPVNQGPTNVGYVVNALLAWAGGRPGALRRLRVRLTGNVFAGDRLVASGEVTAVQTVDEAVVASCDVWLDRDDGTRLVTGTAEVVVG